MSLLVRTVLQVPTVIPRDRAKLLLLVTLVLKLRDNFINFYFEFDRSIF